MVSELDNDKTPEILNDQDQPGRPQEALADERFARGEAFIARYWMTFEALAKQDNAADREIIRQIELGDEIMNEYGETFGALAKPID